MARSLEIPIWMFDRAVCVSEVRFAVEAFVDLEALSVLSALLDQVLKTNAPSSNARLRDAFGVSREQNRRENHGAKDDDGVSDWAAAQAVYRIPTDEFVCTEDARETLIGLMTRLMLEHAQAAAMPKVAEAGYDR